MMKNEAFLIKLREAFAIEAEEHVQALTAGLLELEKTPAGARQQDLIEIVFREAHSLKGAAGAVDRSDLQAICQVLESIFSEWQRQPVQAPAETFDSLNQALDLVRKLLRLPAASDSAVAQDEVQAMVRQLDAVTCTPVPQPARPATPPPGAAKARAPKTAAPVAPEAPTTGDAIPQFSETVRLPMAKMDALLRRAEEMIAVKLSASQHALEVRGLRDRIDTWQQAWAKVRDSTRSGLTGQSPATLAKVGDFLECNQSFMLGIEKRLTALASTAGRDEHGLGILVDDLLADAKRLVMLPCSTLLDLLPKLVRDLARATGKEADVSIHGREVEIDKRILQEMKDPLIHLVRNSVDHGIEPPAERLRAGKPSSGTLTVAVSQRDAGKVEIVVSDDGAGIDAGRVKAAAVRAGSLSAAKAAALDGSAALAHIFDSGVSTSPIITEISGRGLGMAIVREKVERLGGSIAIESAPGSGTTFRIVLPVTLATFKGVLVGVGGQTFVIPTASVWRVARVGRDEIQTVENTETMLLDGHNIALVWLDEVLELPPRAGGGPTGFIEVVVLGTAEQRIGFAVDDVFHEQEVLVKNIGRPLLRVRNVAGATVLGSGTPAVILNAADLLKSAVRQAGGSRRVSSSAGTDAATRKLSILVTDDSVTSRMLLKNILESSGYQVTTAIDGADALTVLKTGGFDLVVSDVEMPRMDGFELTAKIRADQRLAELPVVLVTALSSRQHQERGNDVGANAYIVKSSFDQTNLLEVIRKLV